MFFKKKPPVAGTTQVAVQPAKAAGKDLRSVKPGELLEHYEKLRRNSEIIPVPVLMAVGDLYRDLRKTPEAVKFYLEACKQTIADEAWTSAGQMLRKAQKLMGGTPNLTAQVLGFQISLGQQMISEATQQLSQLGEAIGPQQGQEIEQVIQVVEREAVVPPEIEIALADFLIRLARSDRALERLNQGIQRAKRGGRQQDAQRLEQHLVHLGLDTQNSRAGRPMGTPTFAPMPAAPAAAPAAHGGLQPLFDAAPPAASFSPPRPADVPPAMPAGGMPAERTLQPMDLPPLGVTPSLPPALAAAMPPLAPVGGAPGGPGMPSQGPVGDLPPIAPLGGAPALQAMPPLADLPDLPPLAAPAAPALQAMPPLEPLPSQPSAGTGGLPSLPELPALGTARPSPAPVTPPSVGGLPDLPPLGLDRPTTPAAPALPSLPDLPSLGLPPAAASPAAPSRSGVPDLPPLQPLGAPGGLPTPAGLPELPPLMPAQPVPVPAGAAPALPSFPPLPAALPGLPDLPPLGLPAAAEAPRAPAAQPIQGFPELTLPSMSDGRMEPTTEMALPALPALPGLPDLPELRQAPVQEEGPATALQGLPAAAAPALAPVPGSGTSPAPSFPELRLPETLAPPLEPLQSMPSAMETLLTPPAPMDPQAGGLNPMLDAPDLPPALAMEDLETLMAELPELPTQAVLASDGSGFGAALVQVLDEVELEAGPTALGDADPTSTDLPGGRLSVYADHLADAAHDDANQVRELARTLLASLRARIPDEEAASHYDIGLAFLQMSMYPEAVEEFQIAFRAPEMRLRSFEGLVEALLGQRTPRLAYTLLRNLGPELPEGPAQMSAQYWMGRAAEQLGRPAEALALYEEIALVDMVFRDVATRLERLGSAA